MERDQEKALSISIGCWEELRERERERREKFESVGCESGSGGMNE